MSDTFKFEKQLFDLENKVLLLEEELAALVLRVEVLEKKKEPAKPPLRRRVRQLLESTNHNLFEARMKAKEQDDSEAVHEIQKLMDKAG